MLCQDCPQRERCKKLCPEAEAYANQDHVRKKEMLKRNIYIRWLKNIVISVNITFGLVLRNIRKPISVY